MRDIRNAESGNRAPLNAVVTISGKKPTLDQLPSATSTLKSGVCRPFLGRPIRITGTLKVVLTRQFLTAFSILSVQTEGSD